MTHALWAWSLRVLLAVVAGATLWQSVGCKISGHRKFTLNILGQTISLEDEINPDSTGQTHYSATFDREAWDVIGNWIRDSEGDEQESVGPSGGGGDGGAGDSGDGQTPAPG